MNKIKILVVLYDKNILDSVTISSLLKFDSSTFHLVVVNNGPKYISDSHFLTDNFISVELIECINNRPLSLIYNEFIFMDSFLYDLYCIFDDDTYIDVDYLNKVKSSKVIDADVITPLIYDSGNLNYPKVNGVVINYETPKRYDLDGFVTIGSGLALTKKLISKMKARSIYAFDNRFALYGVDFSLFKILKKYFSNDVKIYVSGKLYHSLSSNSEVFSEWRHIERLYDVVLMAKFYSKTQFHFIYRLLDIIKNEIRHGRFKFIFLIVKISFMNKHPRC